MDYTGINTHIQRIQAHTRSFAQHLSNKHIDHTAMVSLVQSQLQLNESLCKQIEKLEQKIVALEKNQQN